MPSPSPEPWVYRCIVCGRLTKSRIEIVLNGMIQTPTCAHCGLWVVRES